MKTKFEEGKKYLDEENRICIVQEITRKKNYLAVRVIDLTANVEMTLENREYDANAIKNLKGVAECVFDNVNNYVISAMNKIS